MNNSEVLELRKRFKKKDNTITKVTGCYVIGAEKRIQTYIDTKLDRLDESEQFKYIDIFKKGLSGVLGKNLLNLSFENGASGEEAQKGLLAVKADALENKDMLESFYRQIINTYYCVGNYLILLIHDVYDVPDKTSDNIRLGESEEVYTYVMGFICPVNLAKPALSYIEDTNSFGNRERDWLVDMPDVAFLFPAFNDRSTDVNSLLYYCKDVQEIHPEFVSGVLGCNLEMTSVQEKEIFSQIVEDVINEAPVYDTFEVVRSINKELDDWVDGKVYSEPPTIDSNDMREIMMRSGIKEEHLENLNSKFEKEVGPDNKLHVDNLRETKKMTMKSGDVQIQVKPESADLVEIRVIDGRKCLVIPMNSDMEVNGIVRKIVEELSDNSDEQN